MICSFWVLGWLFTAFKWCLIGFVLCIVLAFKKLNVTHLGCIEKFWITASFTLNKIIMHYHLPHFTYSNKLNYAIINSSCKVFERRC